MNEKTKYYLVVERFDRYDSSFIITWIEATTVKTAIEGYLEADAEWDIDKELTIDKDKGLYVAGYYVDEEHTIGIGTTKEEAAMQYIDARIAND